MASNVTDVATLLEVIAGYDDGRDHRQHPGPKIKYSEMVITKDKIPDTKFVVLLLYYRLHSNYLNIDGKRELEVESIYT